ncbi:MAG: AAA family ATPase [Gemmatimonadales bacterium]
MGRPEAVIFCGIQGAGKTSFYRDRFFDTHVRLSLDLLGTRRREQVLVAACLDAKQSFVIDNTNVTRADRAHYVEPAHAAGFRVVCYFFPADPKAALARNLRRPGKAAVPPPAVLGTAKRLEPPSLDEGFDALYQVELVEPEGFSLVELSEPQRSL